MEIVKEGKRYKLKVDKEYYIFEPIPHELKIITLGIIKKLPREIKEQILHKLIIYTIKDRYIYETIIREFESILYY